MKKLTIILCLLHSFITNAQTIDFEYFNPGKMNEALFSRLDEYSRESKVYTLIPSSLGEKRIYNFLKRFNEKLTLNDLCAKINEEVLTKYDSPTVRSSNMVGNVGIIDTIFSNTSLTYKEAAERSFSHWINSPGDSFFISGWSQVGEAITYYNKKTKTLFLFFAFFH
jgi:hypothetical protein